MSDTASSSRSIEPVPVSQNSSAGPPEQPHEGDSSSTRLQPQPHEGDSSSTRLQPQPVRDDDPTIISTQPPVGSFSPISDSAYRILQGRILPGDKLGHFDLVEYIGGGGMGRVFRAIDTSLARSVALKVLSPNQSTDEETILRFRNEAQSAARLDHENIARVHYVGEDHGLHYIVFEFIEGVNIRELVKEKGPLALSEAVSYTLQLGEALVHASKRDVVHRDIKPSNVIITPAGHVKLIDMGLARLRRLSVPDAELTASGVTLGTFDYISPEQARDPRFADVRSDIYSLGCTFFYMLASRPPFPEGTVLQKLLQHQGDQPPAIQEIRPELPDETDRILGKMLAKDPRDRYQEPERLVHDLLMLGELVGLHRTRADGKRWILGRAISALYQHLPWIAPIAALICIVTALHFFWAAEANIHEPPPIPPVEQPREPFPGPLGPHASTAAPGGPSAEMPLPNRNTGTDRTGLATTERPKEANHNTATSPPNGTDPPGGTVDLTETKPLGRPGDGTGNTVGLDAVAEGLTAGEATSHAIGVGPRAADSMAGLTAAGGTPAAGIKPGTSTEPTSQREGLLVVGDAAEGKNTFQTLGDACSAAANGDVIELRYNGPRKERPIKLANLKVTIRAGEGYRPVVAFHPDEVDPIKYSRRMFTLSGGRLTLVNLAVEFHVPREIPADDWAMIETQGDQTVRLDTCTMTIRNASTDRSAYHPEVAFFLTKASPGSDLAIGGAGGAETPVTSISLVDCVVRGEADFLRNLDLQPVHLDWNNGLLATTERLLLLSGGQKPADTTGVIQIDLWHLTAVMQRGLCLMTSSELNPHQLPLEVVCANSILVANSDAVLIEQVGRDDSAEFRRLVTWQGDRNFYETFTMFGRLCGIDHQPLTKPMDFDSWQGCWPENEILPAVNRVKWRRLPSADRPLHTHTPLDYALDKTADSDSAIGAASDGRNAGCEIERLPKCTTPRIVEKPAAPASLAPRTIPPKLHKPD